MRCRFFGFFGYLCECGVCVAIWLVLGIAYVILGCAVVVKKMVLWLFLGGRGYGG